jgi:elongation of very long chain fatty acids protein 6
LPPHPCAMLIAYPQVPELFDTLFVVLRKKKLIFLHWYHHVTVLLFCWHSYMTMSSAGLYFISMNYGVHALMYFCEQLFSCCDS